MEELKDRLSKFSTSELKQELFRRKIEDDETMINHIKQVVCRYYGVSLDCIHKRGKGAGKSPCRKAKKALYYIFREQKRSLEEIAMIMKKNHTTIMFGHRSAKGTMEVDRRYREEINYLIRLIEE